LFVERERRRRRRFDEVAESINYSLNVRQQITTTFSIAFAFAPSLLPLLLLAAAAACCSLVTSKRETLKLNSFRLFTLHKVNRKCQQQQEEESQCVSSHYYDVVVVALHVAAINS